MHEKTNKTGLTSAEISNLWNTYMNDSLVICIITHFLYTVEDQEIKPYLQETIDIAHSHLREIEDVFRKEKIVKPKAFTVDEHVHLSAPRLFSDMFYMEYMQHMSKFGLTSHAAALAISARQDIRKLYESFIEQAVGLNQKITELMKSKGVFIRPPYMSYPSEVEFVKKQEFLTGFFGRRRPLLGVEAAHLYLTAVHNEVGKATLIGFAQVAEETDLREYFYRGAQMSSKILNQIHDVFQESNVPASMTWDSNVSKSTISPYSDQLMLSLVSTISMLGIAAYGTAISMSVRHDLGGLYFSFLARAMAYAEDGVNKMIERSWMEQPPGFADREEIIKREK